MPLSLQDATTYYHHAIEGHVFIRETLDLMFERVAAHAKRCASPRVLELGAHTGFLTERLLRECPHARVVVHDEDAHLVALARQRLGSERVEFHEGPLEAVTGNVDIAVSVARHHHLPHDYAEKLAQLMGPDSTYIVADELCPEYCTGSHATRIRTAPILHFAGGYVLTSTDDVAAHSRSGTLPLYATELERLRQTALWRWYRYVVDEAVERGYFDIAVGELQSARDDLVTGSDAEHKFSPLIVERQLALAGFEVQERHSVGPSDQPELCSMFVLECARLALH